MDAMGVLDQNALPVHYQKISRGAVPVVAYPVIKIVVGHVKATSIYMMVIASTAQLGAVLAKMEFV